MELTLTIQLVHCGVESKAHDRSSDTKQELYEFRQQKHRELRQVHVM